MEPNNHNINSNYNNNSNSNNALNHNYLNNNHVQNGHIEQAEANDNVDPARFLAYHNNVEYDNEMPFGRNVAELEAAPIEEEVREHELAPNEQAQLVQPMYAAEPLQLVNGHHSNYNNGQLNGHIENGTLRSESDDSDDAEAGANDVADAAEAVERQEWPDLAPLELSNRWANILGDPIEEEDAERNASVSSQANNNNNNHFNNNTNNDDDDDTLASLVVSLSRTHPGETGASTSSDHYPDCNFGHQQQHHHHRHHHNQQHNQHQEQQDLEKVQDQSSHLTNENDVQRLRTQLLNEEQVDKNSRHNLELDQVVKSTDQAFRVDQQHTSGGAQGDNSSVEPGGQSSLSTFTPTMTPFSGPKARSFYRPSSKFRTSQRSCAEKDSPREDTLAPLASFKRSHGLSVSFRDRVGASRNTRHSVDIRNLPSYLTNKRTSIVDVARGAMSHLIGAAFSSSANTNSSNTNIDNANDDSKDKDLTSAVESESDEPIFEEPIAPTLSLGQRVALVKADGSVFGTVGWIGRLADIDDEWSVGVEFDTPIGDTDGTYAGRRYFYARANYAMFLPLSALTKTDNYIGRPETGTMLSRMSVSLRTGQMISIQRTTVRLQHCFLNAPHQRVGHDVRAVSNRLHCQCHNCGPCAHLTKQDHLYGHHSAFSSSLSSASSWLSSAGYARGATHSCHFAPTNDCCVAPDAAALASSATAMIGDGSAELVPSIPPPRAVDLLAHHRHRRHRRRRRSQRHRSSRARTDSQKRKARNRHRSSANNDSLKQTRDAFLTDVGSTLASDDNNNNDATSTGDSRASNGSVSSSRSSQSTSLSPSSNYSRRLEAGGGGHTVRRFSNNLPIPYYGLSDDIERADSTHGGPMGDSAGTTMTTNEFYELNSSAFMLKDDTESKFRKRLRQCMACLLPASEGTPTRRAPKKRRRNSKKAKLIEYRRRQSTFVPSTLARPCEDMASHGLQPQPYGTSESSHSANSAHPDGRDRHHDNCSSCSSQYSRSTSGASTPSHPSKADEQQPIPQSDYNVSTFALEHRQTDPDYANYQLQSCNEQQLNSRPSGRQFVALTQPPKQYADDTDFTNDNNEKRASKGNTRRLTNDDSHDSAFVECVELQEAVLETLVDHPDPPVEHLEHQTENIERQLGHININGNNLSPDDRVTPQSNNLDPLISGSRSASRSSNVTISTLTTTEGDEQCVSFDISTSDP